MKSVKLTKTFGYPPDTYSFTGEYQGVLQGFYKADRNKKIVYVPIYINKKGKRLIDMEQIIDFGKK